MKKQWLRTTGIILLAAIMVAGVNAQPRAGRGMGPGGQGQGPGYGQGAGKHAPMAFLNLTDEQEQQLKELRMEHYKVMKPLKAEMLELKARERKLLAVETPDLKAVHKAIDDQTALSNKLRKLQVENRLEMKSVLTEEQQLKLEQRNAFAKKKRNFARGKRGGGRGSGGPGQGNVRPGYGRQNS